MGIESYSLARDGEKKLSANFKVREFACKDGSNTIFVCDELVQLLQNIRDHFNRPVTITSAYRTVTHNKKVGGSPKSQHLYGTAADWRTLDRSINPVALGIIAQSVGFGGIGIYWHSMGAFVHTDTRGGKATWLCTTPGDYPSTSYSAFIMPTIKQGCTGAANRSATIMLQKLLKLKSDGSFGPGTAKAVMLAQEHYGLKVDGVCGPATWRAVSGANKYL